MTDSNENAGKKTAEKKDPKNETNSEKSTRKDWTPEQSLENLKSYQGNNWGCIC